MRCGFRRSPKSFASSSEGLRRKEPRFEEESESLKDVVEEAASSRLGGWPLSPPTASKVLNDGWG
jgi:hypothetical protein